MTSLLEIFNISSHYYLLFGVAFIAGTIDTLAGGGGLITVPALLMTGLPPIGAIATNKFQACVGSATATWMMIRKGKILLSKMRGPMTYAFLGSAVGSISLLFIDAQTLSWVIPCVLICIAVYFLLAPQINRYIASKNQQSMKEASYQRRILPIIGAYDGILGPGTGSFFTLAGVSLQNNELLEATAKAKALNFATNIASLIVFTFSGAIAWKIGLFMMAGQFLGAMVGANLLIRAKPEPLRWLIVVVCLTMLMKYLVS